MPRLKNKKHELYCYALVYHELPKIRAVEFAGFSPYPMSYKRIEKRPEVQERLKEMQGTPKELIYDSEAPPEPPAMMRIEKIAEIRDGMVTHQWLMYQLMQNMEQARNAGKFKDANEAIKLMGGLLQIAKEETEDDPFTQRARAAGLDLNALRTGEKAIPSQPQVPVDMGRDVGDDAEAEEEFIIPSPEDADDAD